MPYEKTIVIPRAYGSTFDVSVVEGAEQPCPTCGEGTVTKSYSEMGAEAAVALRDGTPATFWLEIEKYAVERALAKGSVIRRQLKAEDITRQW